MSKFNNKVASLLSALILSAVATSVYAQTNPIIIIDNHGRPILIYNNPCTNKPYSVSPGVKVYPSPLISSNCDEDENGNNQPQNKPQVINPMIYPPSYPYIPIPNTKEDALGGIGMGLGYGLGRALK